MLKAAKVLVLGAVVLGVSALGVLAEEVQPAPHRAGGLPRVGGRIHVGPRIAPLPEVPLPGVEAVKTEMERYRAAMAPIEKAVADLRTAIMKEVQAGTAPDTVIKNHADEAKELAKKLIAEYTAHVENMAKIAKENGDATVNALADQILKPAAQPEQPAKPLAPAPGAPSTPAPGDPSNK